MKLVYHKGPLKDYWDKKQKNKKYREQKKVKQLKEVEKKDRLKKEVGGFLVNSRKGKVNYGKFSRARIDIINRHYEKNKFQEPECKIPIEGQFGLEADLDNFLEIAGEIIDCKSKHINIDINGSTKIWPSAITLLCSLHQWRLLISHHYGKPQISSTDSNSDSVNAYLTYCGFYKYVNRQKPAAEYNYDASRTVKIHAETTNLTIEEQENKLHELITKYSSLSEEELDLFFCKVLPEIFLNVVEHGVNKTYPGWFVMAQCHENSGFISLCIADNGIGIKNTLLTGPQKDDLLKPFRMDVDNDGELIKKSLELYVSGAPKAKAKKRIFIRKKYGRGEKRGTGLQRVTETCKDLSIPISIISQKGCITIDENGRLTHIISKNKKIFAGTLYHFAIPTKKV